MQEVNLFSIKTPYRQTIDVKGFEFGSGEKTVCFVGAMRGNEIQQMYIASLLVKKLGELEKDAKIFDGCKFLIVPCVNPFSMNIGKRFWPVDNTDINRMFPGYDKGETTQRIAASVFESVKNYRYGIQFASFYLAGDFVPHVRIMKTGYQSPELAKEFGLPYVLFREPAPIDTTTLNYNWQIWQTEAYSVYTKETDSIDDASAKIAVNGVLRFLNAMGFAKSYSFGARISEVIEENELVPIVSNDAGLFRRKVEPGEEVKKGSVLAVLLDPLRAKQIEEIRAPKNGVVFFAHKAPTITEHETAFFLANM